MDMEYIDYYNNTTIDVIFFLSLSLSRSVLSYTILLSPVHAPIDWREVKNKITSLYDYYIQLRN